jgi:hypothetical protein
VKKKDETNSPEGISYNIAALEKWAKEGAITKDVAEFHIKDLEEAHKRYLALKLISEKAEKEGRELGENDVTAIPPPNQISIEDIEKTIFFHKFLIKNREKLLQILQQKPTKKRKIRHSGHLVDQKVKTTQSLDSISSETQKKINEKGIEIRSEGIKLSPTQDKLLNALMKLLHEKSENSDESSGQFYAGNCETTLVPYGGGGRKGRSATIRISPTELYKAYLDRDQYSGADIKFIKSLLSDTEQQKFLIIYERKYEIINEKGKKESRTDRVEDFQSLFKVVSFFEGLTDAESQSLDKGGQELRERKGELVIALNPLLTDQINSKYVEYPDDINKMTVIASGGHRFVTTSIIALRDYLLRELSNKRKEAQINEDNLIAVLRLEKYKKEGRGGRLKSAIQKSIQAVNNLGLITNVECVRGVQGQKKYVFSINLKFYE